MTAAFLPLRAIRAHLPEMARRGVSEVCRGPGGFLEAYADANGDPARLPPWWHARRAAFVARMHGQAVLRGEPPRDARGRLTRRSLALIAWAFDPEAERLTERQPLMKLVSRATQSQMRRNKNPESLR